AQYAGTRRADKLVLDLEQQLCRRSPAKLGVLEPIFWHLVLNHHRSCRVPVLPNVLKRAAERFRASMTRLRGIRLSKGDVIVHIATGRETAMLLDRGEKHMVGPHIRELVEFARRTDWAQTALADITTAYYAGRTGAIVRIVEHLPKPSHADLEPFDLS